ncbi:ferritin-like domain-containing protein [Paenibacillus sp.]|uniref:ferritin-like domain-containing protein n=1 Tax=Paenibacillus sp. TaxID=58172 RepID=UPI0028122357|nr:ferritin-like domain-containing protein [Paenibacillus sp.]
MDKAKTIKHLNEFLQGRYMGIRQYEHLIHQASDEALKDFLQHLQASTKDQAARVAKRIQDLGGQAANDVSIAGRVEEWMSQLRREPRTTEEILSQAYKGEHKYGIHVSHDIVEGELDAASAKLIDEILDEDHRHVEQIQERLGKREPAPSR